MANITLIVPDSVITDFVAMVKANNSEAATFTSKQCFAFWLTQQVKPQLLAYRKGKVDASDYTAKAVLVDTAQTNAVSSLKTLNDAIKAVSVTDADGVS